MPTVGAHIPDEWKFADVFSAKVSGRYKGKPGRYLLDLLEKDLSGSDTTPEATGSTIIVDLAKRLRPELADTLAAQLATLECSQPLLLAKIIEALEETLSHSEDVPRTPRPIVSVRLYKHTLKSLESATHATYEMHGEDALREIKHRAQHPPAAIYPLPEEASSLVAEAPPETVLTHALKEAGRAKRSRSKAAPNAPAAGPAAPQKAPPKAD